MNYNKIEDIIKLRLENKKLQKNRHMEKYRIQYLYKDILKEIHLEFQNQINDINKIMSKYYGELIVTMHSGKSGVHSLDKNNRIDDNLIILVESRNKRIMEQYYNFINNHSFFEVAIEKKRGTNSEQGFYFLSKYQFFDGSFDI
jgi:hypothetical protein